MLHVYKWVMTGREHSYMTHGESPREKFLVCELFGYKQGDTRQWLYRHDDSERGGQVMLTIVSYTPAVAVPTVGTFTAVQIPDSFFDHSDYLLRVRWLSEVTDKPTTMGVRGKARFVYDLGNALEAATAALTRAGMQVMDIVADQVQTCRRPKNGVDHAPYLDLVTRVKVSDKEALLSLVTNGIGGLKSYGFGAVLPKLA